MGGYGLYIWLSYGLTIVILVTNLINPALRKKEIFRSIRRSLKRKEVEEHDAH